MKNWHERLALILMFLASVGTVLAIFGYQHFRMVKDHPIILETRAPENGNFRPSVLRLTTGQKVLLEIRNPETVSHGFASPSLGIGVQEIKPGQVKRIAFTPARRGRYPFFCSTWCTVNHMKMKGEVVVQ